MTHAYQEWIVRSTAEDTVYTTLFDLGWPEAPHQVLRNTAFQEWEAAGRPASGQRPGREQHRWYCLGGWHYHGGAKYGAMPPLTGFSGDMESIALYAERIVQSRT